MRTPAAGTCTGPGRRASRSVLSHHRFELRNPARVDASPTIGAVLQVLGSLQELSHVFEAQLFPRYPEETDLVQYGSRARLSSPPEPPPKAQAAPDAPGQPEHRRPARIQPSWGAFRHLPCGPWALPLGFAARRTLLRILR